MLPAAGINGCCSFAAAALYPVCSEYEDVLSKRTIFLLELGFFGFVFFFSSPLFLLAEKPPGSFQWGNCFSRWVLMELDCGCWIDLRFCALENLENNNKKKKRLKESPFLFPWHSDGCEPHIIHLSVCLFPLFVQMKYVWAFFPFSCKKKKKSGGGVWGKVGHMGFSEVLHYIFWYLLMVVFLRRLRFWGGLCDALAGLPAAGLVTY